MFAFLIADRDVWYEAARSALRRRMQDAEETQPRARNVVMLVGDGMGLATATAARMLAGQRLGLHGEDHELSWDRFPAVALTRVTLQNYSYIYLNGKDRTQQGIYIRTRYVN